MKTFNEILIQWNTYHQNVHSIPTYFTNSTQSSQLNSNGLGQTARAELIKSCEFKFPIKINLLKIEDDSKHLVRNSQVEFKNPQINMLLIFFFSDSLTFSR